jgi:hypothetical protein
MIRNQSHQTNSSIPLVYQYRPQESIAVPRDFQTVSNASIHEEL